MPERDAVSGNVAACRNELHIDRLMILIQTAQAQPTGKRDPVNSAAMNETA